MSNWPRTGRLAKIVEASELPRNDTGSVSITMTGPMISPVASIVRDLSRSTLSSGGTPTSVKRQASILDSANRKLDFSDKTLRIGGVDDNNGLFKNAFKIRSTPEGSVKRRPKARRLLGMASRRLCSPETTSPSVDKENGSVIPSPVTHNSSPKKIIGGKSTKSTRCPLEDCDPNSQDSGYGASFPDRDDGIITAKGHDGFRFAEPLGVAPRRMSVESRSPLQSPVRSSSHRPRRPSFLRSLSSDYESMDDGFNELIDMDSLADGGQPLPNGITDLLSGHIVVPSTEKPMECDAATTPEYAKTKPTAVRRSLSLQNFRCDKTSVTPPMSKVRSCLFRSPNASSSTSKLTFDDNPRGGFYSPTNSPPSKTFKRPEPPTDSSPVLVKRSKKCCSLQEIPECTTAAAAAAAAAVTTPTLTKPTLHRSLSETEAHAHIKSAIHRSTTDADLTGDFSKPCILPLAADGHHEDLKSITPHTLAALIRGEFNDFIGSYTIVDCRYPYEYEGGHIDGAVNLYSKDLIEQRLLQPITHEPVIEPDTNKRDILVFHCEFSWERGPNLSRFLRNIDRQRNKEHYPALHYPEVYLLHGGYQEFFATQKSMCSPQSYRPMKHPDHEADLRQFRSKSKSWQGEKSRTNGLPSRANLKRLGF